MAVESPSRPSSVSIWGSPEVWIKFLGALLGLAVAFGAALFSTVYRDSGNVWATVGLASVSLIMAVVVGLTTVPYLARRAAAERMRLRFEYDVTRVGVAYVLMTLVIAIAALNTGNNLLYIVDSAMLGAILVSGLVSSLNLRGLQLDVRMPERVFAGQPVQVRVVVRNTKRRVPSLSLRVVPLKPQHDGDARWQWEASTFSFPPRSWGLRKQFQVPDRKLRRAAPGKLLPRAFDGMAYFPVIRAGGEAAATTEITFQQRGAYANPGFAIATRFPFAFFTKTLNVKLEREVLVYPRLLAITDLAEMDAAIEGAHQTAAAGEGTDLYRIREYQSGDSARQLDWKATAKSSALMVREFSREQEQDLRVWFENPPLGALGQEEYERLVAVAASFAWQASRRDTPTRFMGPSSGAALDVYGFLAELSLIQAAEPDGRTKISDLVREFEPDGALNVIVASEAATPPRPAAGQPRWLVFRVTASGKLLFH